MKLEKDQRAVVVPLSITDLEGPLDGLESRIRANALGSNQVCNDAEITSGWSYNDWELRGWRPATEKEMEKARRASAKAKEAALRKKEKAKAAERAEYERLRKKFANIEQIDDVLGCCSKPGDDQLHAYEQGCCGGGV